MDTITIGDKLYVTLERAAEQTHYDREYLRKLAKAQKLDAVQIGTEWLVYVDSIAAYQEAKPQRGAYSAKKKES